MLPDNACTPPTGIHSSIESGQNEKEKTTRKGKAVVPSDSEIEGNVSANTAPSTITLVPTTRIVPDNEAFRTFLEKQDSVVLYLARMKISESQLAVEREKSLVRKAEVEAEAEKAKAEAEVEKARAEEGKAKAEAEKAKADERARMTELLILKERNRVSATAMPVPGPLMHHSPDGYAGMHNLASEPAISMNE